MSDCATALAVIMRAVLQYGAVKGERYRIRLVAVPPHWAGIDENLSVRTIDAPLPGAEDD